MCGTRSAQEADDDGNDPLLHRGQPVGELLLLGDGTALTGLYMEVRKYAPALQPGWRRDPGAFSAARTQLAAYFAGELHRFELRLSPRGTP
ncbi:MAG: hypothetical protein ACLGI7_05390, partial [Gammaproteobacteria bacterium]